MGVPYDGHLSDTWALGVILYSLFEDRLPLTLLQTLQQDSVAELRHIVLPGLTGDGTG